MKKLLKITAIASLLVTLALILCSCGNSLEGRYEFLEDGTVYEFTETEKNAGDWVANIDDDYMIGSWRCEQNIVEMTPKFGDVNLYLYVADDDVLLILDDYNASFEYYVNKLDEYLGYLTEAEAPKGKKFNASIDWYDFYDNGTVLWSPGHNSPDTLHKYYVKDNLIYIDNGDDGEYVPRLYICGDFVISTEHVLIRK